MKKILIMITCVVIVPMSLVVMLVIIANEYGNPEGIGAGVFYNAPIIFIILAVLGAIVSDKLTGPKN